MSVKILKLITGEDLLADVLAEKPLAGKTHGKVTIKNPIRIVVMPNKIDPKTPNIGFAPWAEFSDDKTFELDKTHVVAIMTPVKEFVTQYNSMFGGIILPQSGLISPGA